MAFDNNFLGQLVNKLPTLDEEIVQILTAAKEPLSVADIYKQSKVAGTSRDISLLLAQKRDQLNIEIAHYATRPGFRECAHYQIQTIRTETTDIEQAPVVAPEIKENEDSEMNTEVNTPQFKIESASELIKTDTVKPKTLQMLEYIEQYPFCTMKEIQLFLNDPILGESYIKTYVKDGRVLISKNDFGKKLFSIPHGSKVADFYGTKVINKSPKVKEPNKFISEIPTEIDVDAIYKNKSISLDNPIKTPAQSGVFRCAYTNDGCLLLLGIQVLPIELNAAQTNDLIQYINETVITI